MADNKSAKLWHARTDPYQGMDNINWGNSRSNRQTADPAAGRSSMDPATADKAEKKKRVWHRRDEAGRSAGRHLSRSNGCAVDLHGKRNNAMK
jgi:hypothetical protein